MTIPKRKPSGLSDQELVQGCLAGLEERWSELIGKYKNLVYSIALRRGIGGDDAADLFQSVWTQVYLKLPTLREQSSIRSWLITITTNQAYHWRERSRREGLRESSRIDVESDPQLSVEPVDLTAQELQLQVQEAIAELTPRCQELIQLLFYTQPPLPYRQVAERMGLAVGSIGFMRGHCLKRLCKTLELRASSTSSPVRRRAASPRQPL